MGERVPAMPPLALTRSQISPMVWTASGCLSQRTATTRGKRSDSLDAYSTDWIRWMSAWTWHAVQAPVRGCALHYEKAQEMEANAIEHATHAVQAGEITGELAGHASSSAHDKSE